MTCIDTHADTPESQVDIPSNQMRRLRYASQSILSRQGKEKEVLGVTCGRRKSYLEATYKYEAAKLSCVFRVSLIRTPRCEMNHA